jgi:sterol 24-C-methyltransferase
MAMDATTEPTSGRINHNPKLQSYYASLESRIGYRLFLGGTRHFGYYESPGSSPLPVDGALRAMEDKLLDSLAVPRGSRVLDAGCGVGHVALHVARTGGHRVQCIDVVPRHVARARANVARAGMADRVSVALADYHHLEAFADASFDAIYTMETLVHSTDPAAVLAGFFRLLRPGGRLVMHEYEGHALDKAPKDVVRAWRKVNDYAAMPANDAFEDGALERLLREAAFDGVESWDMSDNIVPMLWLFYLFALVPYFFVRLLGLESRFVNTVAGVESYRGRKIWKYLQVSGTKPEKF